MRLNFINTAGFFGSTRKQIRSLLLLCLVLTTSIANAQTAPANSDSLVKALADLNRQSFERPNSMALRLTQRRVDLLARTLRENIEKQAADAKSDSKLSNDQRVAVQANADQSLKWLSDQVSESRMPIQGVITLDQTVAATVQNLAQIDLHVDPATREQLVQERSANRGDTLEKIIGGGKHFSSQYATYGAASFLMSVSQLGLNYQTNPAALDQWMQGLKDPVGAAGFAVFMAVNHPVGKMLEGTMTGTVPRMMIPYIGMMAGSLGSTVFHDLYADVDFQKCFASHFGAARDEDACNRSYDHWVLSNLIVKYTPNLVSMVASQAIADAGRMAINLGLKKSGQAAGYVADRALERVAANVVFRGITIKAIGIAGRIAQAGSTVAAGAFTPGGFVAGGVQFVAFLYLDSKFGEPIVRMKDKFMLDTFNVTAWLNKQGFHRDFFLTPKGATQMIANAFDVEAKDLYSSHQYVMQEYGILAANGWATPKPVTTCVPLNMQNKKMSDFAAQPVVILPIFLDAFRIADRWLYYSKSNDQLRCEVLARPNDLFDRYAELNKSWRSDYLLGQFEASKQNWTMMIGNFFSAFDAAHSVASYLAEAKFKLEKTGEKSDLSRETLEKLLQGSNESADGGNSKPEAGLNGVVGHLRTPTKLDEAIASLACGPGSSRSSLPAVSTLWNKATSYFQGSRATVQSPYVGTRFGGAFFFKAPNLTTGDGKICDNGENRMKALGESDPTKLMQSGAPTFDTTDVVTGKFYDRKSGKVYIGLAEYIIDNMQPAVYQRAADFSNFSNYWVNVQNSIESVWNEYGNMYDTLVHDQYLPIAFRRDFDKGCDVKPVYGPQTPTDADGFSKQTADSTDGRGTQQQCFDSSTAYRVGNGSFLAMEIELRNYLRGLYSLNTSLYQGENMARLKVVQHDYLTIANELIAQVNGLKLEKMKDPDDLETYSQTSLQHVQAIKELIEARMKEVNEPQESFRRKTLDQLVKASNDLIVEQQDAGKTLHLMNFEDANSRPSGQSGNTKKAFNPYSHGG